MVDRGIFSFKSLGIWFHYCFNHVHCISILILVLSYWCTDCIVHCKDRAKEISKTFKKQSLKCSRRFHQLFMDYLELGLF